MYIAMDCETGGIGEGTSLLSVYFAVLTDDFKLIEDLNLLVKPENGAYVVQAKALEINKINLIKHDAAAMTYKQAGTVLYEFLNRVNPNGLEKLEPLGHRVTFDIELVKENLLASKTWEKFVSYRIHDTGVVGSYLKKKGLIPLDVSGSLGSYAKFFGVNNFEAHTADGDVNMTIGVYKAMLTL